jgi:Raf kinase inhibitor-like YbhB/YbcL family protein
MQAACHWLQFGAVAAEQGPGPIRAARSSPTGTKLVKIFANSEKDGEKMGLAISSLQVTSSSFGDGEAIPSRHTQDDVNASPPLSWSNVPDAAQSFALFCHDPDAPFLAGGNYGFVHWILYNIPGRVRELTENTEGFTVGANSLERRAYDGPKPPRGHGMHRYYFWLLALNAELYLDPELQLPQLLEQIQPHVLGMNRTVGTYAR